MSPGVELDGQVAVGPGAGSLVQRHAQPEDVDAIWSLIESQSRSGLLLPRSRGEIATQVASFRVAEVDGLICGVAALRDYGSGVGELRSLTVADIAQGQGIGSALVRAVMRDARHAGIRELYVVTPKPDFFSQFAFESLAWDAVPDAMRGDGEAQRAARPGTTAMLAHPDAEDHTAHEIHERERRVHLQTYPRQPITLVRGRGSWVWDDAGNRYLDLVAGIAVNVLGHANPAVASAISGQAQTLLHVSNLYYTVPQIELAERLTRRSPFDRAFFTNSGTEANEAALKLARRHGGPRGAHEIVALEGSFHGRTFGSLAATGQPKYREPFAPLPDGFRHVPRNDADALEAAVGERTCAILLEPIQGESGIHPLTDDYLAAARRLCDRYGALLIFDEVQTGMGRTGTFFAFEQTPVTPDVATLAKGLGGGVPIGAVLVRERAAAFQVGDHGTTLGGNPLACVAALATLRVIDQDRLLDWVRERGAQFADGLARFVTSGLGSEVRGRGLMLALETAGPWAKQAVAVARDRERLLINATGETTLRFVPPLTITAAEVDEALARLERALDAASGTGAAAGGASAPAR